MNMIIEAISNFRLAEQRFDNVYSNLSEDQLDEILGGLRGAYSGMRAGYRAGGLGGAWSGAQLGAARGREREKRADAAQSLRVQRAVNKSMPVSATDRRRDTQFKKSGGPMTPRDVAAMRVANRPEYRHMSMNQVKDAGSPESLKASQLADRQARWNAPDEAAAWAKKIANRLARRAAKAAARDAPRNAAATAKAGRIAALSPEAQARLTARKALTPKPLAIAGAPSAATPPAAAPAVAPVVASPKPVVDPARQAAQDITGQKDPVMPAGGAKVGDRVDPATPKVAPGEGVLRPRSARLGGTKKKKKESPAVGAAHGDVVKAAPVARREFESVDSDYKRALIEGLNRWRKSARNGTR